MSKNRMVKKKKRSKQTLLMIREGIEDAKKGRMVTLGKRYGIKTPINDGSRI